MGCQPSSEARLLKFIERGDVPNTRLILNDPKKKVDVNDNTGDWTGVSPIIAASRDGNVTIIKMLIEKGADVNKKYLLKKIKERKTLVEDREKGISAVFEAASNGHDECVSFLIKAGANPNTPDEMDRTALHRAVRAEHLALVKVLVNFPKTNLNAVDYRGETPMSVILTGANPQIAIVLLEAGAEPPTSLVIKPEEVNPTIAEAICCLGYARNKDGGFDKTDASMNASGRAGSMRNLKNSLKRTQSLRNQNTISSDVNDGAEHTSHEISVNNIGATAAPPEPAARETGTSEEKKENEVPLHPAAPKESLVKDNEIVVAEDDEGTSSVVAVAGHEDIAAAEDKEKDQASNAAVAEEAQEKKEE